MNQIAFFLIIENPVKAICVKFAKSDLYLIIQTKQGLTYLAGPESFGLQATTF